MFFWTYGFQKAGPFELCILHILAEVVQSVPAPVLKQTSWSSFEENTTQNQSAETLLKALKNVQQSMYTVEVILLLMNA